MGTSVAFAAEGGISAALALASRLMAESPQHRLWFFYAHHGDPSDELEQLLALKDRYVDRLALGVVTERESDEAELLSGTLDGTKVRALASRLFDAQAIESFHVFGPGALGANVRSALSELGVESGRIHAEQAQRTEVPATVASTSTSTAASPRASHGGSPGALPPASTGALPDASTGASTAQTETVVSFVMDGRRRSFPMRTNGESILDAAARAGVELPFSCKAGVCSTCRTKLVRGEVEMAENYALEDWELQQGFILACQSCAKTPEIELTYDET